MANKDLITQQGCMYTIKARRSGLGGSIGVASTWVDRPDDRIYHEKCYKYATVYVDQFSGFSFIHLQ